MKKIIIIFAIVILATAMLLNVINMNNADLLSNENTTEFSATVSGIEQTGSLNEITFLIQTIEYGDKIRVHTEPKSPINENMKKLNKGDSIKFRVENIWLDNFDSMPFFEIVSLETEKDIIISMDEQNKETLAQREQVTYLFSFLFISVCITCGAVTVYNIKHKKG